MDDHSQLLADFRSRVSRLARRDESKWEASKKLIEGPRLRAVLQRMTEAIRNTALPDPVKRQLLDVAGRADAERVQDLDGRCLKTLTGLPPAKGIRALCVYFDLIESPARRWPISRLSTQALAEFVRGRWNPFDALREADVSSVLDLGAGDLSFAQELAEDCLPQLRERGQELILHCLDRLQPGSKLGGPLHPDPGRLDWLRSQPGLRFRFFGDQDMFETGALDRTGSLADRYTVVTCWAPATPTFAYEPTRLSAECIARELARTKGRYQQVRFEGENALEVQHGGRALLFPAWKFDIRGPAALLDLLSRRGLLGVLGAVDSQVFWELLSQLIETPVVRPQNQPFTPEVIPALFGETFTRLSRLPEGESVSLADLAPMRRALPRVLPIRSGEASSHRFRYVEIRRGATFKGMPASSTARRFRDMPEETSPWMLTLVPE